MPQTPGFHPETAEPDDGHVQAAFDLFLAICDLPSDARALELEARCAGQPRVRALVERLMAREAAAAATAAGLANESLGTGDGGRVTMAKTEAAIQPIGSRLAGRYRIVCLLGEGGMGAVYEAEQLSPRRRVALKAFRSTAIGGDLALRRFALEAEVLARLQHPSIAQVYEAGFGDDERSGPAWIAMELVRGERLDVAAAHRGLDHATRLALFLELCDAITFAHQKGVIHRDLKPANILLTEPTEESPNGRVKVLDFGIARIIGSDRDEATALTGPGQLLGTLPYMSPEQVAGESESVDVRTDVYALGVVLYELLVGRRPLDLKGKAVDEAVRAVRQEIPPLASKVAVDAATAGRLRGDLDAILERALAKRAADRYGSVASLAEDLRAHLAGEPIVARSGSGIYVIARRMSRHRVPIAISLLVVAAIGALAVRASLDADRSERIAQEAGRAERAADSARRALAEQLSVTRLEQARLLSASGNLAGAVEILRAERSDGASELRFRWALRELAARHPCTVAWQPHHDQVRFAALLDDDSRVLSASEDGRVVLSSIAGETLLCADVGRPIVGGAYDASDGSAIIGGVDAAVLRVRADTLEFERLPMPVSAAVRAVAAYEGMVAVGDAEGRIGVRRGDGVISAPALRPRGLTALAFLSKDELVAADDSGEVALLGLSDGSVRVIARHDGSVIGLCVDRLRRRVVSGGTDRMLQLANVDRPGEPVRSVDADNGTIRAIGIDEASGDVLVSGWWSLDRWDETLRSRRRMASPPDGPTVAQFAADRGVTITGHADGALRRWEITNAPVNGGGVAIPELSGRVASALSRDGTRLLTGDGLGSVTISDASTGLAMLRLPSHARRVRSVAIAPDGSLIASAGDDHRLLLSDARTGTLLARRDDVDAQTSSSIAFSADGRSIALCSLDRFVRVLSLPALNEVVSFQASDRQLLGVAWSPDGTRLATTARDRHVRLWSASGEALASITTPDTPWTLAFSPDGTCLAIGEWSRSLAIVASDDLRLLRRIGGAGGLMTGVAWLASDDPQRPLLLGSCADGTVRVWDAGDGRPLFEFVPFLHADTVSCSADASGGVIAASGTSGEAGVWRIADWDRWTRDGSGLRR